MEKGRGVVVRSLEFVSGNIANGLRKYNILRSPGIDYHASQMRTIYVVGNI